MFNVQSRCHQMWSLKDLESEQFWKNFGQAGDFALNTFCLSEQQSLRPAWFQFVLEHKPRLMKSWRALGKDGIKSPIFIGACCMSVTVTVTVDVMKTSLSRKSFWHVDVLKCIHNSLTGVQRHIDIYIGLSQGWRRRRSISKKSVTWICWIGALSQNGRKL